MPEYQYIYNFINVHLVLCPLQGDLLKEILPYLVRQCSPDIIANNFLADVTATPLIAQQKTEGFNVLRHIFPVVEAGIGTCSEDGRKTLCVAQQRPGSCEEIRLDDYFRGRENGGNSIRKNPVRFRGITSAGTVKPDLGHPA